MNRHERRKKRAQERKARRSSDTMGASYQLGGIRAEVLKAGREGGGVSPEYAAQIESAAKLIVDWCREHPTAELRWVKQKEDGTFVAAVLCDVRDWIADSPDAFALLDWLDEQTARVLTLNQTIWALRICRALPMPDGSFWGTETVRESAAHKTLRGVLEQMNAAERNQETDRVPPYPCPHCGKVLDGATSQDGHRAKPGDITLCIYCGGINRFTEGLGAERMPEEAIAELPEDVRVMLEEMQATLRNFVTGRALGGRKGPAPEA